jgi:hypothetical protein
MESAYKRYFVNMIGIIRNNDKNELGVGGADAVIQLSNGRTVFIDEKIRSSKYESKDILIELDHSNGVVGWANKNLSVDYIAYCWLSDRKVLMLEYPLFKRLWKNHGKGLIENGEDNKNGCRIIEAENRSYVSRSLIIPTKSLLSRMHSGVFVHAE